MDDLVAFVRARLDEDEETAKAAARSGNQFTEAGDHDPRWQRMTGHNGGEIRDMCSYAGHEAQERRDGRPHGCVVVFDEGAPGPEQAAHIARHDPARALREVAAKRELITFAPENAAAIDGEWGDGHEAAEIAAGLCADHGMEAANEILGPLAAVWSDHPDYRPEWKP